MPQDRDVIRPEKGWHRAGWLRLSPLDPGHQGWLLPWLSRLGTPLYGRPRPPGLFALLLRHRRLFWSWLPFATLLMPWGRLPARDRERLILRVAYLCRCRYEWAHHVSLARRRGLSDQEILDCQRGWQDVSDDRARLLLMACDELFHENALSDATWVALSTRLSEAQLLEMMMLVGHTRMMSGVLNSCGLPPEEDAEHALRAFNQRARSRMPPPGQEAD